MCVASSRRGVASNPPLDGRCVSRFGRREFVPLGVGASTSGAAHKKLSSFCPFVLQQQIVPLHFEGLCSGFWLPFVGAVGLRCSVRAALRTGPGSTCPRGRTSRPATARRAAPPPRGGIGRVADTHTDERHEVVDAAGMELQAVARRSSGDCGFVRCISNLREGCHAYGEEVHLDLAVRCLTKTALSLSHPMEVPLGL